MSESEQQIRYLIVVRFGPDEPVTVRARKSVPEVKKLVEHYSRGECQLAFTSRDGSTFGYLLKTATPLRVIHRALYGELHGVPGTGALLNGDDFFGMEVGVQFDGRGFSRGWTWLQHH